MNEQDLAIANAWFKGDSIGSLAKKYKLDKSQIKKVINRVRRENGGGQPEVVYQLPDKTAVN